MNFNKKIKSIKQKISNNEIAIKIIKNSSWLVADKVFTMIIGVFVTAIIARYFGPQNYGKFNYALSFVTLFTAFSTLGLEILIVKAIVDEEQDEGTILCTSFILRLCGGVILTFVAFNVIKLIEPNDTKLHTLVVVLSLMMVFKAFEVIEYWIQAHQRAKISSIVRMVAYVIFAGFKLIMVLMGGTIVHFTIIYTLDAITIGIGLVIAYYINREEKSKWKFDIKYAKSILSQSWYLILSSMMVTLYMQIDRVMLGAMMPTTEEVGIYSAATQVASMWYFVPMAIITSFKPVIMSKKKTDEQSYIRSVQLLYTIVAWLGIAFGVFILIFSKSIINILYGPEYQKAANILTISIWAGTFAMLGSARSVWSVTEGLQRYNVLYTTVGAIINIVLNYLLIPIIGGYGAAVATLISQITVAIIVPLFIKKTRISAIMILRTIKLKGVYKLRR